jgi:AcrR family transcriptional regulator
VLEITQAADVGMGSFYNYFDSKEQLFQAALNEIFDSFGAMLDRLPPVDDPAEMVRPQLPVDRSMASAPTRRSSRAAQRRNRRAHVGSRPGAACAGSIAAANRTGRFRIDDLGLAVTLAAAALSGSHNCYTTSPSVTPRSPPNR